MAIATQKKINIFDIQAMSQKDQKKAFSLLAELLDIMEESLENSGTYSREFKSGLKKSIQQSQQKKLRKINSLAEL